MSHATILFQKEYPVDSVARRIRSQIEVWVYECEPVEIVKRRNKGA